MQTNYLLFYHFQSVFLRKAIAFLIAFFLLFNLILSPYTKSINLTFEIKIQKDVFSTVLFVSETIEKMSMSISNMFALKSKVAKTGTEEQSNKAEPAVENDFLFLNQMQNKKTDGSNTAASKIFEKNIYDLVLIYEPRLRKQIDRSVVSNFLERMLFYISSKSTYDNIVSLNNINRLFIKPS